MKRLGGFREFPGVKKLGGLPDCLVVSKGEDFLSSPGVKELGSYKSRIFRKQGESAEGMIREIHFFLVGKASLAKREK